MSITSEQYDQIREGLARREKELISLHRALVSIPTINRGNGSAVNETALAETAKEYLSQVGINASIHAAEPGRGNLLAEIGPGTGPKMLWMSHSDVVPAGDETAWTHPPFSAALVDGRIYGRGSNDCKMLVAGQLFALACLARMDLPRRGALRLAIGADEEVGGQLGFGWLAREKAEFLKCDIAICEGGGATLGKFNGEPVVGVSTGEKGRYDVTFQATSDGGHACAPWKHLNPLLTINTLLERIARWRPELQIKAPIFPYVTQWFNVGTEVNAPNLESIIGKIEESMPGLAASLRGQSRMTLTPTVIEGGDKANQIPTEVRLVCDARLLPGQTEQQLETLVSELASGLPRLNWKIQSTSGPSVSPWTEELASFFERATQRALNGMTVQVAPTWCIGATDARYVRAVGTPVYGYQLVHPAADQSKLDIHCVDESIEAGMLLPCALSLAYLAAEYLSEAK